MTEPVGPLPIEAPPGVRARSPRRVVALLVATVGVYALAWGWRVTREADAWVGPAGSSHRWSRWALGPLVLGVVGLRRVQSAVRQTVRAGEGTSSDAFAASPHLVWVLAAVVALVLVGCFLLVVGLWRAWTQVHSIEARLGLAGPLRPGQLLAWILIPGVNLVTGPMAAYRTQKHLNRLAVGAGRGTPWEPAGDAAGLPVGSA